MSTLIPSFRKGQTVALVGDIQQNYKTHAKGTLGKIQRVFPKYGVCEVVLSSDTHPMIVVLATNLRKA